MSTYVESPAKSQRTAAGSLKLQRPFTLPDHWEYICSIKARKELD